MTRGNPNETRTPCPEPQPVGTPAPLTRQGTFSGPAVAVCERTPRETLVRPTKGGEVRPLPVRPVDVPLPRVTVPPAACLSGMVVGTIHEPRPEITAPRDVEDPVTLIPVDADPTLIGVRVTRVDTAVSMTVVLTREQQRALLQELQAHLDRPTLPDPLAGQDAAFGCWRAGERADPCSDCVFSGPTIGGAHEEDVVFCWQLDDAMNVRR